MIRADICHARAPKRKCVCHISRHSSVVAVLEGIRGALIQTRAVKSVRGSPLVLSRHVYWQLCARRWWVTPCHAALTLGRESARSLLKPKKETPWCLWERSCAWKIHVPRERTYRSHLVELYEGAPTAIREIVAQTRSCDFISIKSHSSHFSKELTFNTQTFVINFFNKCCSTCKDFSLILK